MPPSTKPSEEFIGLTGFKPLRLERTEPSAGDVELWGALADLMQPVEGVDLTAPTGEIWTAASTGTWAPPC